jgi:hypothetical protein
MTNEELAQEISEKYKHYNVECSSLDCYLSALEMAKRKDSQPKIVEIFGKRVKIVEDGEVEHTCKNCAFDIECDRIFTRSLCENANGNGERHFVEVDEDGNEIKKEQKQTI